MTFRRKYKEVIENDFEWHAILRVPESKVDMLEEVIAQRAFEEALESDDSAMICDKHILAINFETNLRRGQFRINDEILGFSVRDLPCMLETHKTYNNIDTFKVADVSQILLCHEESEPPQMDKKEIEHQNELASTRETRLKISRFAHGLCPPMRNVRKVRFRRNKKSKFINAPQIEQQLYGIFRRDMEANKIEFQFVDENDNRLDTEDEPILESVENASHMEDIVELQPPSPTEVETEPPSQKQFDVSFESSSTQLSQNENEEQIQQDDPLADQKEPEFYPQN